MTDCAHVWLREALSGELVLVDAQGRSWPEWWLRNDYIECSECGERKLWEGERMDFVLLSASKSVIDGLRDMVEKASGPHEMVHGYVDIGVALLIVELAKRAPDRDDWFIRGKWATIQAIESRTRSQIDLIDWEGGE